MNKPKEQEASNNESTTNLLLKDHCQKMVNLRPRDYASHKSVSLIKWNLSQQWWSKEVEGTEGLVVPLKNKRDPNRKHTHKPEKTHTK